MIVWCFAYKKVWCVALPLGHSLAILYFSVIRTSLIHYAVESAGSRSWPAGYATAYNVRMISFSAPKLPASTLLSFETYVHLLGP